MKEDKKTTDIVDVNTENNIEILPERIIAHEMNLLRIQIFPFSKSMYGSKEPFTYPLEVKKGGGHIKIIPSAEHGHGGAFDDKALMALNKIVSDIPKPVENPIDIGSWSGIARTMGEKHYPSSAYIETLKTSFRRMTDCTIVAVKSFYDILGDKLLSDAEGRFHLLDKVVFKNEVYDDNLVAETNLVWLNESVLRNINNGYICLLDIDLYYSLDKYISKGLLKVLSEYFYANRHKDSPVQVRYSKLCSRITVKPRDYLSRAKEQFDDAHAELIDKGYLEKVEWEPKNTIKKDWYVKYWPGELANKYHHLKKQISDSKDIIIDIGDQGIVEDIKEIGYGDDNNIERFISIYISRFQDKFSVMPNVHNKEDAQIVKELVSAYDIELLESLLDIYLKSTDEFIKNRGFNLYAFKANLNGLIVKHSENTSKSSGEKLIEELDIPKERSDADMAEGKQKASEIRRMLGKRGSEPQE